MSKVITLTSQNFESEVLKADIPVLVDFWAPWCVPCRMMAPVLDEVSEELADKVKIAKLDIEDQNHQELALQYNIMSIPNLKLFKDGKVVHEFTGFRPKPALLQELSQFLTN